MSLQTKRILFCNIAWMKYYQGVYDDDIPQFGGSYVERTGHANECYNFLPVLVDGEEYYFGSFETKSTTGKTVNTCHIERINGCSQMDNEDVVHDVLVVWCAKHSTGSTRVIGWYNNASVYRYYQEIELNDGETSWIRSYNITALAKDSILLPFNDRKFRVPRKSSKNRIPHGFGSANVWYASEESALKFINEVSNMIESYNGENLAVL